MEIFDSWVPSESNKIWLDYNNITWNDSEGTDTIEMLENYNVQTFVYSLNFFNADGSVLLEGQFTVIEGESEGFGFTEIYPPGASKEIEQDDGFRHTGDFGDWMFGVASNYMKAPPSAQL